MIDEFIQSLNDFNYSNQVISLNDINERVKYFTPPTKGYVRCAISEILAKNALLNKNFNFFSKDDFSDSKYDVLEVNNNLKFSKQNTPIFEFDYLGSYKNDVFVVEVKSSEPKKNFNPNKILNHAQNLIKKPVSMLIFAPFRNDATFKDYSNNVESNINVINMNLSAEFYSRLIRNFYSRDFNLNENKSNYSLNDEIADILSKI